METPCYKLAEKIIERLVHEKLLTDQHGKKLIPKFTEGKLRPEDWRLAFELSDAKENTQ
jgi:hypothetical protein